MALVPDSQLVLSGFVKVIAYAMDSQGRMPAKEFLERRDGAEALTKAEKAGFKNLFERMANAGKITNKELFRKEEGEIFAFKKNDVRIAAFQKGNVWYLTHGFRKKKDKWRKAELERADRIRIEHLS